MDQPPINYDNSKHDNSKHFHVNLRPRDAVLVIVLAALLNGLSGACFAWLFQ